MTQYENLEEKGRAYAAFGANLRKLEGASKGDLTLALYDAGNRPDVEGISGEEVGRIGKLADFNASTMSGDLELLLDLGDGRKLVEQDSGKTFYEPLQSEMPSLNARDGVFLGEEEVKTPLKDAGFSLDEYKKSIQ